MARYISEEINFESDKGFEYTRNSLLKATVWIGLMCSVISFFSPNPLLCVPSFLVLYIIIYSLFISRWFSGILLAFIYQWVQVAIKPIYANLTLENIYSLSGEFPIHIVDSYILSCVGLGIMVIFMAIPLRRIKINDENLEDVLANIKLGKLLILYFSIQVIVTFLPLSLFQVAVQLNTFKWGVFFIIFLKTFWQARGQLILAGLIVFEFVLGFASFFSSWKDVVFYTVVSYIGVAAIRMKQMIILSIVGVGLVYLGLLWTGVKGDYRKYISQGGHQVVSVSKSDAYAKMIDLAGNFKPEDKVSTAFVDRISYIDYFSGCLGYVPSKVPHEHGKLTFNAITHVLIPRFMNPNKEVIDESTHLTKYTGRFFSNRSMGVSFSLGYMGDLYVDYGAILMMAFVGLLGYGIGFIFLNLTTHIDKPIMSIAVLELGFGLLHMFEISLIKLVGTVVMFWIVYRLMARFVFPRLMYWLNGAEGYSA